MFLKVLGVLLDDLREHGELVEFVGRHGQSLIVLDFASSYFCFLLGLNLTIT